jgi:hypothetical protein
MAGLLTKKLNILIVVLAEGGNLEQASCGGYEEPSGRTLLKKKLLSVPADTSPLHLSLMT